MNIKSITIQIIHPHPDSFYPNDDGRFHFAIHSPNTLPVLSNGKDFMLLENRFSYGLYYSRVETRLLGSGFDTNCFNYNLDHKFANYNMRSDCIASCFQSRFLAQCKSHQFNPFQYLQRKELFEHDNLKKI